MRYTLIVILVIVALLLAACGGYISRGHNPDGSLKPCPQEYPYPGRTDKGIAICCETRDCFTLN